MAPMYSPENGYKQKLENGVAHISCASWQELSFICLHVLSHAYSAGSVNGSIVCSHIQLCTLTYSRACLPSSVLFAYIFYPSNKEIKYIAGLGGSSPHAYMHNYMLLPCNNMMYDLKQRRTGLVDDSETRLVLRSSNKIYV